MKIEEQLTKIILSVFLANGQLLSAGDRLIKPIGLTSARWQVMGAIVLAEKPISVPQIAAKMGLSRQAVQRQVDLLIDEEILLQLNNQEHKRSPVFEVSKIGRKLYAAAEKVQSKWVKELVTDFSLEELEITNQVLRKLTQKLK